MATIETRPRVVVVGAGFGGLQLAKALRRTPVDVLLIDQNNYHTFQPLLYQVATAALEADEIAETVRGIMRRQKNFRFRMGRVTAVDWDDRHVVLGDGSLIPFDYLVLAAGASTNTFGVPGVEEHGFELKQLEDAITLRNHIIAQFEEADRDPGAMERGCLNFVVVGAGPTGVETAGALRELFTHVLRKDFPQIDIGKTRVVLVEATDAVLGTFAPALGKYAARKLDAIGVDIMASHVVTRVERERVVLKDKSGITHALPTRTVVWSAGVRASTLADQLDLPQTRGGRIVVGPDLSVEGQPGVFVVGDMAASLDANGELHPQLAPVAIQGANHVARAIAASIRGKSTTPFRYRDKGTMATIGRGAAVAELGSGLKLRGWPAWAAWALVHLTQIVGLRNKVYVYANWVYNYLTYDRSARLLIPVDRDRDRGNADGISPGATRNETVDSPVTAV